MGVRSLAKRISCLEAVSISRRTGTGIEHLRYPRKEGKYACLNTALALQK
jgi:hypothetical protein